MDQLTSRSAREPVTAPTDTKVNMRTWVVTEVIGTFTLVSVAGAAVLSRYPLPALGLAVVLMVLIYAVGHFAGGHLNAAVTLAVLTRRSDRGACRRRALAGADRRGSARRGDGARNHRSGKDYRSGGTHCE